MLYGRTQEFTLVTKSGVFHQAGICEMGPGIWCPQLAEKAKPAEDYDSVFYTRLASPEGGKNECFHELLAQADRRITTSGADPVVRIVMHTSDKEYPGVAYYVTEAEVKALVGAHIDVTVKHEALDPA
jgi:hypothetical protein